jgi:mannose-6-phosphate isomerase
VLSQNDDPLVAEALQSFGNQWLLQVHPMKEMPLYPLRFDPIYQYRLWGGRRLGAVLSAPLPGDGPIGEAWVLSDRDGHPSKVTDGPLRGRTIRQLLQQSPERLLGKLSRHFDRFPLLLKFLDVTKGLSVQVHPSDAHKELIPSGDTGKDEAWVVLSAGVEARIFAGLKADSSAQGLRQAIAHGTVPCQLTSFVPKAGDGIFIAAGTVHSLSDVVVFEVQENSDVTFRLYDWDHLDPRTGRRRPLQTDQAIACIDFQQRAIGPVTPAIEETTPVLREKLVQCTHFGVTRITADFPFVIGETGAPRVLVCLAGNGQLEHAGSKYFFGKGDVLLLAAEVGACSCLPQSVATVLDISLPAAA